VILDDLGKNGAAQAAPFYFCSMKFLLFSRFSALTCSGAILALTLVYPYSGDNVLFAYITDLFLRGIPPYAGAWDHAFPGVMLVHVVQLTLLGKSTIALHAIDTAIQLLAMSSMYSLARRFHSDVAGWSACVIYCIYYTTRGSNMIALTDGYVACIIIIALNLAYRDRAYLAAFLFGLTIVFRPTYGLLYVLYVLWDLYVSRDLKRSTGLLLTGAIPVALLITLSGASGHFDEFFISVWTYNVEVYNRYAGTKQLFEPITRYALLLIPAFLGFALALRRIKRSGLVLLTLAAAIASLFLLIHAPYQYPPLAIQLALLAGIGWGMLVKQLRWNTLAKLALIAAHVFFLVFYLRGTTLKAALTDYVGGATLLKAQSHFEPSSLWGIVPQEQVANFLIRNTDKQDRVQGLAPLYPMFMAGVLPSNRFIIPLGFGIRSANGRLKDFQLEWRKEYIRDLGQRPPKYYIIADSSQDARPFLNGYMPHEFIRKDFAEIGAWLDREYRLDTTIGSFFIYGRLGGSGPIR
jgi:hypothetical protein